MKKTVVWVMNIVVTVLALLAMLCYFMGPVWEIQVTYPLPAEVVDQMLESSLSEYDVEVDEDVDLNFGLKIQMDMLLSAIGANADATVQKIIDGNVDSIAEQLKGAISSFSRSIVEKVVQKVVTDRIHEEVNRIMQNEDDAETTRKLEAAGINDEYIAQKTEAIYDCMLAENAKVDDVAEIVIETVEEVYVKLADSGEFGFDTAELTDSDKNMIREQVQDVFEAFSRADGSIAFEDYINQLVIDALRSINAGDGNDEGRISLLAIEASSEDELTAEVRIMIEGLIPEELAPILFYVMLGLLGLVLISMLSWAYILIKLLVKLIAIRRSNPTVKLKVPIIFGWLPYLILDAIPTLVFLFVPDLLAKFGLEVAGLSVSFASIGFIAAISAAVCFVISIFYMIVRKSFKKEKQQ